jgi:uncharacterized protein
MLKVSRFTVAKDLARHGQPGHRLVFNTFSGACVLLPETEWDDIVGSLTADTDLPPARSEARQRLVQNGILAAAEADERRSYEERFAHDRFHPSSIFPILAVTTACNIACTYCYEEGVASHVMTPEVVAGVLRWMERRVAQDGIRSIHPNLFGGEPLLYPKLLFALMEGLRDIGARYPGLASDFSMSSNGMLLTPELARDLAVRGLSLIQISLDGPADVHNQRRVGHHGQASFEQCVAGIRMAAEAIPQVTLKVNFDRHNRTSIGALFDWLVAEGLGDRITVKLEAIALQIGSGTSHDPAHVIPPQSPELADAYVELMLEAKRRRIRINPHTAHTTPCMWVSDQGVIIGPRGNIYKCISLVGREQFRVGTVFDEDYSDEYGRQMDGTKRVAECWAENCPYIPVCAGGCAYESIVRTGRYDERFCTKEYLDEFHYKRYLLRYEDKLKDLGVEPLNVPLLRQTAAASTVAHSSGTIVPASRRLTVLPVKSGCGPAGCCRGDRGPSQAS